MMKDGSFSRSQAGGNGSNRQLVSNMKNPRLRYLGMAILVVILVITGSYVRIRPVDDQNTADWLVVLQLAICGAGAAIGIFLLCKNPGGGFGTRMLIAYLLAVLVSAIFSPYIDLVFGYWALLAGAGLLCLGLVSSSTEERGLHQVENVVVATVSLMLVKDLFIDAFLAQAPDGEEVHRLGMGVTSSNVMGQ